jgi:hypothetical protein
MVCWSPWCTWKNNKNPAKFEILCEVMYGENLLTHLPNMELGDHLLSDLCNCLIHVRSCPEEVVFGN